MLSLSDARPTISKLAVPQDLIGSIFEVEGGGGERSEIPSERRLTWATQQAT